ncbi:hypothetical protein, partial [Allokutzneria sp. NRRL B-24872]|uniref:hypothetical protein n=1 Tax=Allokutzneria sp. NRRL B-24872 TaxID=1137961 RepID=UPI00143CEC7E
MRHLQRLRARQHLVQPERHEYRADAAADQVEALVVLDVRGERAQQRLGEAEQVLPVEQDRGVRQVVDQPAHRAEGPGVRPLQRAPAERFGGAAPPPREVVGDGVRGP